MKKISKIFLIILSLVIITGCGCNKTGRRSKEDKDYR